MQDISQGRSIGRPKWHLNFDFERKCAGGLPGYFARTFDQILHMFGTPIVVVSSFVLS